MPGPDGKPGALVGGASLWVVDTGDDVRTAASWDFITYLTAAQQQSEWSSATGYLPVRTDALTLDPGASGKVELRVDRRGVEGPLQVSVAGSPTSPSN